MALNHNHPLYLSSSDVPGALYVGIQLTGMENYVLWSRAMEIALLGRNKLGFIDDSVLRCDFDGALKKIWDRCNAIVIFWLTCNVSKELLSGILYSSSAHQGHTRTNCNKLKKCDHCHTTGHVKDDCFLLIGYPGNFKGKKKANAVIGDGNMYPQMQNL